ncbi:MAG: hypothetical protein Harvfovirus38_15 [Harvfovirus sp.]|uniref:Uncharacterized protein n=1 Tax=Harvfovirus sp. TaxID=2487768 RepID=A0A3G5A5K3_9VIRU|nr:MAG: hypothetical protein Harvfovirus38_15 [Harvfovirus sp.]
MSDEEKKKRLENKYQVNLDRLQKENIDYDGIDDINIFFNEKITKLTNRVKKDGSYISAETAREYIKSVYYYHKKVLAQEQEKKLNTTRRMKLTREVGKLLATLSAKSYNNWVKKKVVIFF